MDLDAIGRDRWNDAYVLSSNSSLWGDAPVPFAQTAVDDFSSHSARTILDLPCGDGRNLPPLADRFATVVGADSSANAIQLSAARIKKTELSNILLLESDIYATSFADGMFDGVFCCDMLGHLQRPANALRELLRICRPGRHVMASIFALEDSIRRDDRMARVGDREYIFDKRIYHHFYDEHAARSLCKDVDDAAELQSIQLVRWMDPPHEGYREHEHLHASWLVTLRKRD